MPDIPPSGFQRHKIRTYLPPPPPPGRPGLFRVCDPRTGKPLLGVHGAPCGELSNIVARARADGLTAFIIVQFDPVTMAEVGRFNADGSPVLPEV